MLGLQLDIKMEMSGHSKPVLDSKGMCVYVSVRAERIRRNQLESESEARRQGWSEIRITRRREVSIICKVFGKSRRLQELAIVQYVKRDSERTDPTGRESGRRREGDHG